MKTQIDILPGYREQDENLLPSADAKERVLIIDDEPMNLKLFKAYLAGEGYELITAENGIDALSQVERIAPDVILLDVMMPGMDGFEVTRRLKQNTATEGIPIILITSLSGEDNKSIGLNAGADEFLVKPTKKAELIARVRSMLRLRRFQEQLHVRLQSESELATSTESAVAAHEPIPMVLVVEDNDKDALLLQKQLEFEPYVVKRVTNGAAAVSEALSEPIDLILLDIMLPGMDGFEVCRRLKGDDQTSNIQVVMLTSLRDLEYRIQGSEIGADDYLVKPVEPRELKARVQALLKKKKYVDRLQNRYENVLNRAISDELTGLFNHGYFKRFFELEVKRSLRQKHPISLLLIDLDNFKLINDRLGHLTGDRLLKIVATTIKDKVREVDFVARYGGEEFAVILPYADIKTACDVAERIRQAIYSEIIVPGGEIDLQQISASIGISFCPDDGLDIEILIRKADEMMYLAKQGGKNQVCVSSDYRG